MCGGWVGRWGMRGGDDEKGSEEGGKERSGGSVEGIFFYVWGGGEKHPFECSIVFGG